MTQYHSRAPAADAASEELIATRELIATARALIAQDAPSLSATAFHQWLSSPEECPFSPESEASHNSALP